MGIFLSNNHSGGMSLDKVAIHFEVFFVRDLEGIIKFKYGK